MPSTQPSLTPPTRDKAVIQVHIRKVSQFFNSMDPSPFHDKDLDDDAADFIISWAREYPRHLPFSLVVHLLHPPPHGHPQEMIQSAVHNFFTRKADLTWREFRDLMKRGQVSLIIGLVFLAACLGASNFLLTRWGTPTPPPLVTVLREGLTIMGWVAMWRPLQIYLYDWWPLRRSARVYQRLAQMPVEVRVGAEPEPPDHPAAPSHAHPSPDHTHPPGHGH